MAIKPPNSRRNLDIAITRVSQGKTDPQRVRLLMANAIVGQMLPSGAVKGGSALKMRFGDSATRFTRDLDTARGEDLESFVIKLQYALTSGWEGFTGVLVRKPPATPKGVPAEYVMQPFEVKLSFNGKSWLTVPLEVGFDEIGDADEPELFIPGYLTEIFSEIGLPTPGPIPLMPLHHQVAQKLHGLTEPGSMRVHDLIDLQVMESLGKINLPKTKSTCRRLFAYRNKHAWPPELPATERWRESYAEQAKGLGVLPDIDSAAEWLQKLIARIEES